MKTFKTFIREFEDLGNSSVFFHNKAKDDAWNFAKNKVLNDVERKAYIEPRDLTKHVIKKLSDKKEHADYTVHHVKRKQGKEGWLRAGAAALLHHKHDGFVGTLYGHIEKGSGFHVSESHINTDHRGKGLGTALYESAVKHHGGVVSDSSLTAASQRVYKHFAKLGRVSIHKPTAFGGEPSKFHGLKVKIAKDKMYAKDVRPNYLDSDYELKLKIHKKKLK